MLTRPVKVLISAILSGTSVALYLKFKGTERKWCMFAMLASTLGDVFMTDILGLGDISTYPGAAFFIIAHIIYALCFYKAIKRKGYALMNKGMQVGILMVITTAGLLYAVMLLKTGKVQSMFFPLLIYLLFIGVNLCMQFSYGYSEGGKRGLLILGMFLFLLSDFLVFLPMINVCEGTHEFNNWIWYTYIPAQLLIILFNSEFGSPASDQGSQK